MDMQGLSEQQLLASLFPSEDAHNDSYHSSVRNHTAGRHPSPASSSSSVLHDAQGGPALMDPSSNIRRNSAVNHSGGGGAPGSNNMFPPSSPIQPQSPNTQLTMQLLGSLMQMQGLDNNFAPPHMNPGFSGGSGGGSANSNMGSYGGASYASSMNMGSMAGNNASRMNHSNDGSPSFGGTGPNSHPSSTTALLEQQIKLQQLQQLQQLQNQIFQQQIALISGQPPAQPTNEEFHQSQQQNGLANNTTSPSFTGLATPGPSNELRPQQPQLDFDHFSQPLPSPMSSHGHHGLPYTHHSDDYLHRGASSAPEHIAFHVRTDLTPSPHFNGGARQDHDLDISPLTSPWLGAYGGNASRPNDNDKSHDSQRHSDQRQTSHKRGPPANGEEAAFSRKKHSTGISSIVEGGGNSSISSMNVSNSTRRPYHKGSKSTTSTPLLRGSRSRSKSGAGNAFGNSPLTTGGSHLDTNNASYPTPGGSVIDSSHSIPGDTPSPVDLSMPPPPPPPPHSAPSHDHPENSTSVDDGPSRSSGPQFTPLTPGVVMKLGPFGTGSTPTPVPSTRSAKQKSKPRGGSDAKSSKDTSPTGSTLKHILPAGGSALPLAGSPTGEPIGPAKKVSHKDAEQKRRDSQKTAYDDLRRLLPPITFEDDDEQGSGGGQVVLSKKKDEVIPVRGPLPPGALPPRGPPKAGGEGPNKGVSKLQLLICGNQYIRTLKGRVERRDGEIAKLRREETCYCFRGRRRRRCG